MKKLLALIIFVFLYGCDENSGNDSVKYTILYSFASQHIAVKETANHLLVVNFLDENSLPASTSATTIPGSGFLTLYDQGGIVITLDYLGNVNISRPYTFPDDYPVESLRGQTGSQRYTIYIDNHTAVNYLSIKPLLGPTYYDFHFYYVNPATGEVAYQANIGNESGPENAEFRDMGGNLLAFGENYTSTYNDDSSKYIDFDQPASLPIGPFGMNHMQVLTPVKHDSVTATTFSNPNLEVFILANGNYWVDVFNDLGQALYSHEVAKSSAQSVIFSGSGMAVEKLADNTIRWIMIRDMGILQYAVNENGLVFELDTTSGFRQFVLHFIDQASGLADYNAEIYAGSPYYTLRFGGGIADVNVTYFMNPITNIETYDTPNPFSNPAATNAEITFYATFDSADPYSDGYIVSTTFTHD